MKSWWRTDPATGHLKSVEEIIAARTAALPPERREKVAQRTIIEILMTRPDVPLTGFPRRHVAQELERLWIPKRELAKISRQRLLRHIENANFLAKWTRKNKAWEKVGAPKPQTTALEAVAQTEGFQSVDALKQFLKRERRAKKKLRP
jgi:hypothetical protein